MANVKGKKGKAPEIDLKIDVVSPKGNASGRGKSSRRSRNSNRVPVPGPNKSESFIKSPNNRNRFTAAGRAWLRNYLNPCGEKEVPCRGVPDGSSSETAIVQSRVDQDILAPAGLLSLVTDHGGSDWFLGLVVPPWVDDCVFLIAAGFQPSEVPNLNGLVSAATVYPEWTASANPAVLESTIWYCRLPEPAFPSDVAENLPCTSYRMLKRGITTELISDQLTNRGFITASQWLCEPQPAVLYSTHTSYTGASNTATETTVTQTNVGNVAFAWEYLVGNPTPAAMTAADSRAFQCEAREGCYMPIYLNGSARNYQPYLSRFILPKVHGTNLTNGDDIALTTEYSHKITNKQQNIGVIWYQAISMAASVRVKGRHTIQAVIQPNSVWSAFAEISDGEDWYALETAQRIQNVLPQAYPAAYNDWGFLGNIVKGLVGKIPVVGGLLSNLVDPAGKVLGGLLGI